ncbi:MAG: chemotaxis protein CheW [Caulobacter sp.]|nr:chemotaxis protein CheW [Caulobacter sp.]
MTGARTSPYITFFVGEAQYAADAVDVSEVFRRPRITRVPGGPPSLLGIAGLRGAAAPVVSLARLLGGEDSAGADSRLLLLAGGQTIGLAVDRVGALTPLPAPDGPAAPGGFGRLYAVEDSALRVLDLDGLLRREFSQGFGDRRAQRIETAAAEVAAPVEDEIALLAFELAGQAYALPLEEVSEALTLPDRLASIAQAEDAVLGVMELRGRLLPVVSLCRLLGLATGDTPPTRVVVTRIGDAIVGLAVDRLNAILRVPPRAIDAAPAVLNRGAGEAQVQSICRLPDGRGLVAILSAERLFRDEKVAHILADGRSGDARMTSTQEGDAQAAPVDRYLIFRIGGDEYGLPLAAVDEVVRLPDRLTRVPRAPAFVEGVLNLRGKVTPIIDQSSRFQAAAAATDARPRIIVTSVEGRQAGFIVDSVSEILGLTADQTEATPEMTADAGRLFTRVATLQDGERLILLIEPRELLDRAERDLLAAMDATGTAAGT